MTTTEYIAALRKALECIADDRTPVLKKEDVARAALAIPVPGEKECCPKCKGLGLHIFGATVVHCPPCNGTGVKP